MLDPAKSIRVMDLFSGIGGFSLALKGITETLAYCEKDDFCQKILEKHFPSSFIIPDIRKIDKDYLRIHTFLKTTEMITAGFPCTDISIANIHGKGLDGEFSGLFSEVLRVLDLLPNVQFMFLENSPQIRFRGLDKIQEELHKRRFSCLWTYVNASDVGALHKRRRWYCFCYRTHKRLGLESIKDLFFKKLRPVNHKKNIENVDWLDITFERLLRKEDYTKETHKLMVQRCKSLGNSIVPQCAAHAWNILIDSFFILQQNEAKKEINQSNQIKRKRGSSTTYTDDLIQIYPIQEEIKSADKIVKENVLDLRFDDGVHQFKKKKWATPNYTFWHTFRAISSPRCETTFMVQLLFEKDSHIHEKGKYAKTMHFNKYFCNPTFVEQLMGFPKNWTKL